MIEIDLESKTIALRRSDYIHRNGKRDKKAFRAIGDGDIVMCLPDGEIDIRDATLIVKEIQRRLRKAAKRHEPDSIGLPVVRDGTELA